MEKNTNLKKFKKMKSQLITKIEKNKVMLIPENLTTADKLESYS
jgi:hypothetical protein